MQPTLATVGNGHLNYKNNRQESAGSFTFSIIIVSRLFLVSVSEENLLWGMFSDTSYSHVSLLQNIASYEFIEIWFNVLSDSTKFIRCLGRRSVVAGGSGFWSHGLNEERNRQWW